MAGTVDGGIRAYNTNIDKYGPDFYQRIGRMGGVKGRTGGFAQGAEGRARARTYGAIGGAMSRRTNPLTEEQRREIKLHHIERQASRTTGKLREQLRAQQRELSEMQTTSLSAKFGKPRGW